LATSKHDENAADKPCGGALCPRGPAFQRRDRVKCTVMRLAVQVFLAFSVASFLALNTRKAIGIACLYSKLRG